MAIKISFFLMNLVHETHNKEEDKNSRLKPTNSTKTHRKNTIHAKRKRKPHNQLRGSRRVEEDDERKRKKIVIWER